MIERRLRDEPDRLRATPPRPHRHPQPPTSAPPTPPDATRPPPADGLLARRVAVAVRRRAAGGAQLARLRLTALDTTLGGTSATTNWGRLASKVAEYNAAVTVGRPIIVRTELLDEVEALLHAGKALDTGFRGVRHRDSRATKRVAAQQLAAEIAGERRAIATDRQRLVAKFDALGADIWRQYIDLKRQNFGSAVFDQGLHGKTPEPGYLASMAAGHQAARNALGQRMTAAWYESLQAMTRAHSNDAAMAGWSSSTDRVKPSQATAGAQFLNEMNAGAHGTAQQFWDRFTAIDIPMGDTFTMHPLGQTIQFAFHYQGKSEAASKARIQKLFDDFYADLRTTDRPRWLISRLHKNLEYMHAFKDANTRTNLVVLNKLLVECSYDPVVLDDPNLSYTQTIDEWEDLLRRGNRRWREIRRAQDQGLDMEQVMQAFDAGAGTHATLGLPNRAASAADLANVDFT
jgi:hypothetical protein